MAWKMVGMDKRWGLWEKWWMETENHKGVSKDTWIMLILFIEKLEM